MSFEAWPSPDSRPGPLPRIDDLPIAEQGYEQEAVRRAFDDFYRHAAQLDASLKALEAVEAFQRDAAELRNDLRSLRTLGFGGGEPGWTASSSWTYERLPSDVPVTALRVAGEAALLIAVAVIAGVSHLRPVTIVLLMAAAVAVVWLCEWLAARARTRVPGSAYEPGAYPELGDVETGGEPAPYVEAPGLEQAVGWSAFEPPEDADLPEPEALTMIEEPPEDTEEDAAPDEEHGPEEEHEPEHPADEPPSDEAEEEKPARGWRRRRHARAEQLAVAEPAPESPTHVRVLTPPDAPWERGFDGEP